MAMAKKVVKKPSKWTVWWNEFFEKRFYILPLLGVLSALWFPLVVVLLGQTFKIMDKNNNFTTFGIVSSILVFLIPSLLTIFKAFAERYKEQAIAQAREELKDEKNFSELLKKIITGFSMLCEKKHNHITRSIAQKKDKASAYDCHEQLETVLEQLDQSASYMLSEKSNRLKQTDLYVSLYYKFNEDETWHCVNTNQHGMSTPDLLEKDTTFKYLLNDNTPNYVFYNSKYVIWT